MWSHAESEPDTTARETNSSCNGWWHFKAGFRVFLGFSCQWFLGSLFDFLSMNVQSPSFTSELPTLPVYLHSLHHTLHPPYLWSSNRSFWQSVSRSPSNMEHRFSFFIFYLTIPFEVTLDVSYTLLPSSFLCSSISSCASLLPSSLSLLIYLFALPIVVLPVRYQCCCLDVSKLDWYYGCWDFVREPVTASYQSISDLGFMHHFNLQKCLCIYPKIEAFFWGANTHTVCILCNNCQHVAK